MDSSILWILITACIAIGLGTILSALCDMAKSHNEDRNHG